MWTELEKPWQVCFASAWQSFKKGSIPIGAAVVNEAGHILADGRSMQYETEGAPGEIVRHKLSHAELHALLKVSRFDHPDIERYTLYSTMEPCPMCFGALTMSGVRNLKYAARDRYAGGTELNSASRYIAGKGIKIYGPFPELEYVQIAMQTAYSLIRGFITDQLLNSWKLDCPDAVAAGMKLFENQVLQNMKDSDADASEVFDSIDRMRVFTVSAEPPTTGR